MRRDQEPDAALERTRAAVAKVDHEGIRADLMRFVDGTENCLRAGEIYFAFEAVKMIVTTVVALDRTIGSDITFAILDALSGDSESSATALRRGLGYTSTPNAKCDIRPFSPPGSSTCVAARNSTCYTLDSGSGCGSSSGRFQFAWDIAAINIRD